jgi:hypothetical protein
MLRASTDLPTRGRRERNGKKTRYSASSSATGDRLISDDLAADVEADRCIDALKAELEALRAQTKAALLKI